MRSIILLFLSLLLISCGGSKSVVVLNSTNPATAYEWYQGKAEIFDATGQLLGTSEAMCRRRLFPAQSLIIEQAINFGKDGKAREFVTVFNVSGEKFRMAEANGSFTGGGELEGEAW